MGVERELADLRERLAKVQEMEARKAEIEKELAQVWVEGGDALEEPSYVQDEKRVYETASEGEDA